MFAVAISIASCSKQKVETPQAPVITKTDTNKIVKISVGNQNVILVYSLSKGTWQSNGLDSSTIVNNYLSHKYDSLQNGSSYLDRSYLPLVKVGNNIYSNSYIVNLIDYNKWIFIYQKMLLVTAEINIQYSIGYVPIIKPISTNVINGNIICTYTVSAMEFFDHYFYSSQEERKRYFCK